MTSPARQPGREVGQGNRPSDSTLQSGQDSNSQEGKAVCGCSELGRRLAGAHPSLRGNSGHVQEPGLSVQTDSSPTAPSSGTTAPTQGRRGPQARPASGGEGWGFQVHLQKDPRSTCGQSRTPRKAGKTSLQPEHSSGTKVARQTGPPWGS